MALTFGQSLLKGFHGVTLGCLLKRWQKKLRTRVTTGLLSQEVLVPSLSLFFFSYRLMICICAPKPCVVTTHICNKWSLFAHTSARPWGIIEIRLPHHIDRRRIMNQDRCAVFSLILSVYISTKRTGQSSATVDLLECYLSCLYITQNISGLSSWHIMSQVFVWIFKGKSFRD